MSIRRQLDFILIFSEFALRSQIVVLWSFVTVMVLQSLNVDHSDGSSFNVALTAIKEHQDRSVLAFICIYQSLCTSLPIFTNL